MRSLVLVLAACGVEHDVEVFVVLPDVPAACATLGATRVTLAIETVDGEAFAIEAAPCLDRLADQEASGFHTRLERLGAGYHRADATIEAAGAVLGGRSLPFSADQALVVGLVRADLPGWPMATIELAVPACAEGLVGVHVTAGPPGSMPEVDTIAACGAPMSIAVSRGPVVVNVAGVRADGSRCASVMRDAVAFDDAVVELALGEGCP